MNVSRIAVFDHPPTNVSGWWFWAADWDDAYRLEQRLWMALAARSVLRHKSGVSRVGD